VNSKQKGKRGELEWVKKLVFYGYQARRGQQYAGNPDAPDVVCDCLPYHFEVKRVEKLNLYDAMDQAARDCGEHIPVVAWRRNHHDWLIVMRADDWLPMQTEHIMEFVA